MIGFLLFVFAVLILLPPVLVAIGKPFADREEARSAKRYADQRAAQEREYQEHMRAEDERARIGAGDRE
jgi:hypothetical protein